MLRRVTQPPHIAGPLGLRDVPTNRDIQRTKVRVWLTPNTYFSCNFFVDQGDPIKGPKYSDLTNSKQRPHKRHEEKGLSIYAYHFISSEGSIITRK
jgi:hypothetical protein